MRPHTTVVAHRWYLGWKKSASTERLIRSRPIPGSAKHPPAARTLLRKLEAALLSVQSSEASSEAAKALPSEPQPEPAQVGQPILLPRDSASICVRKLSLASACRTRSR